MLSLISRAIGLDGAGRANPIQKNSGLVPTANPKPLTAACDRRTEELNGRVIAALIKRGAGFKSPKEAWAELMSPHGRLPLRFLPLHQQFATQNNAETTTTCRATERGSLVGRSSVCLRRSSRSDETEPWGPFERTESATRGRRLRDQPPVSLSNSSCG